MSGDTLPWKHGALTIGPRAFTLRAMVRDSEGRPLCRWCGTVVKHPRRAWCSQECVKEYAQATALMSSAGQRDHLMKVEKGVCRSCDLDVEQLQKRMQRAYRLLMRWERVPHQGSATPPYRHNRRRMMLMIGQVVKRRIGRDPGKLDIWRSWWEADHITPLVEGGQHTADNLRTLCIWCHRVETAALATRRAERNRS